MKGKEIELSNEAKQVLQDSDLKDGILHLPDTQLDRELYQEIASVLKVLDGKWNRKSNGFVFKNDVSILLKQLIRTGKVVNRKKNLQFFATPYDVVRMVMIDVRICKGYRILEPSAGTGAFIDAIIKDIEIEKVEDVIIDCIEFDPLNCEILRDKYKDHPYINIIQGDFMEMDLPMYDLVVMNPPFAKNQDVKHITKAFGLLTDFGVLHAISSISWEWKTDKVNSDFRELVNNTVTDYWKLDAGLFKDSGTSIPTMRVLMRKEYCINDPSNGWNQGIVCRRLHNQPE